MYRTHIMFGVFLAVLALFLFKIDQPLWFFGAVLFGSIFVDIDESHSFFGRRVKPLSWFIQNTLGHRGVFHSLLMATIIAFIWYYFLGIIIALGFLLGYVGHLLMDGITQGGVRIFFPFSKYQIRGFFRTGGFAEMIFFVLLSGVTLWFTLKVI